MTEGDAARFADRYNAPFDPEEEEDENQMAWEAQDPKTGQYSVIVPL